MAFIALGAIALTASGVVAAIQPSNESGCVLAAYGGVFIIGVLLWASHAMAFTATVQTSPEHFMCLVGVAIIMYARWATSTAPSNPTPACPLRCRTEPSSISGGPRESSRSRAPGMPLGVRSIY